MKGLLHHPMTRYGALALVAAAIIIAAVAPISSIMVEGWSRHDIDLRAQLIFRSIRDQVENGIATGSNIDLVSYFDRLAEDERLLALGYCTAQGELRYATKQFPATITCADVTHVKADSFDTTTGDGRPTHISIFPLVAGDKDAGDLLVLHDLQYMGDRVWEARIYTSLALIGVATGVGLLATAVVLALMRSWNRSIRGAILDLQRGREPTRQTGLPIARDIQALLSEFRLERKYSDSIHIEWSPATLHRLLREELPGTEVCVVSNREPYIHNHSDGGVALQIPASGLVAALEPVMRACGGTWIAHGSGSADRETVDANDRLRVPPADPSYTLRRVWLTEEEQAGYYYGFSNEGLWPLCHIAFVRPTFRDSDWGSYQAVNERFADVVAAEATREDPIILVQDYHFALLPALIRKRLPRATILTFWHIPWPNAETFSICPWREQIIEGLLGSSILGFHTQFHCNNFLEAVDRFIESRIDREHATVSFGGHETMVRPYPISIEWPPAALANVPSVKECRAAVKERYGISANARIAVGVERFDYTKGIIDRIRAVDDLLTRHPEWRGKFVFIQAAAPTRSKLDAYSSLQSDAARLADEVNERYGSDGYKPVLLVARHHEPDEVFELFRSADVCIVSSLHDGMNLVAKEFVASRDDEQGVLVLSHFAGASRELSEALIVNPYDTKGMAEGLDTALRMSPAEQRDRLRLMRDMVRQRNVYRWAAQMLLDAALLRRRESIISAAAEREAGDRRGGWLTSGAA